MDLRISGWISTWSARKWCAWKLAFFWVAGLICGVLLFQNGAALMPETVAVRVSAGDLLVRVLIPFLVCLAGVLLDQLGLIYGCAFVKAALFCHVSLCAMTGFGSGGWLIRLLFLFTDTLMCVIWYLFWLDCLSGKPFSHAKTIFLCAAGFFIAGVDLRVITPLLMRIINS